MFLERQRCFSNAKLKRQGLILEDLQEQNKNVFTCVVGFVGGQEMGGAASLHELSVKVIIFSLSLSFFH